MGAKGKYFEGGICYVGETDIWENDSLGGISTDTVRAFVKGIHPLLSLLVEAFGTHPSEGALDSDCNLSGGAFKWTLEHVSRDHAQRPSVSPQAIFTTRTLPDAWALTGQTADELRFSFTISGDTSGFTAGSLVRLRVTARPAVPMPDECFRALCADLALDADRVHKTDDD